MRCLLLLIAPCLHAQTITLERLVEYGWDDVSQGTSVLTPQQRALGGGSLASVNGAVEGQDGRVYVLDLLDHKVAVFDADGGFHAVVGGNGEGPGEFRRPARIAADPSGVVYVWDPQLSRITRVDATGAPPWMLSVRRSGLVDFAVSRDTAWFGRLRLRPGEAAVGVSMRTGLAVDSFARLDAGEVGLSAFGATGSIAAGTDGSVVFAGPFPGQIRVRGRNRDRTIGENRYPDAHGFTNSRGTRIAPVSMRDAAIATDGRVALLYSEKAPDTESDDTETFWIEILRPDGRSLGRTVVGAERAHEVSWTRDGNLLLSVIETYPRVWRMRVVVK